MTAEFTTEEQKRLIGFFTNLERPIFGLKLPQEVAGALFSRYSRSSKSLRRTFLDEFLGDPELGLKDLLGGQPLVEFGGPSEGGLGLGARAPVAQQGAEFDQDSG